MSRSAAPARVSAPHRRAVPALQAAEVDGATALLHTAVAAARATLAGEFTQTGIARETTAVLDWIVRATTQALSGRPLERGGPAASGLGLHCLGLLRQQVLLAAREKGTVPAGTTLELVEAMEAVREAIAPSWSDAFVARLGAPSGYDLVVSLAHDLRSPLTSVLFLADTLRRGRSGAVTDLQRHQLGLVYSAALGLSSLTNDVIELARGGDTKDPEPFSLAELFEGIHDMIQPLAEEKGVAVTYTLPPVERRVGFPAALSRVLLNLTTNALKFTDQGEVAITCTQQGYTKVEFAVRDTGRGISPEAMANLYQPFHSVGHSKRRTDLRFSGTGLGLAMCRKLLNAMGSDLQCETRVGAGTTFSFKLELPPAKRL